MLPAFCDSCGAIFDSQINVENSTNVAFEGNSSGPCPKCGGWGHVPDGVFNFISNTIEILSAPERTIAELTRLAQLLDELKEKAESREQVASRIEREAPFFVSIAKLLPENKGELYNFLTFVSGAVTLALAAVSLAIQLNSPSTPTPNSTVITVNQVVQQVIVEQPTITQDTCPPGKKPSRNEACPCGSGKKYKKCCGKIQ